MNSIKKYLINDQSNNANLFKKELHHQNDYIFLSL